MNTATLALQPSLPPILPSTNLLGHLFRFRDDPLGLFEEGRALGDVVRMRVGPRYITAVYHPDAVHRVLVERLPFYTKHTRGYEMLRQLLGNGLLTSEGALWKRQRRIAQPAFQHRRIGGFADTMVKATEALAAQWQGPAERGEVIDVAEAMNRLALKIAGETLFSQDISGDSDSIGVALSGLLGGFLATITNPLRQYLPFPSTIRYRKSRKALDALVYDIIARRRADPVEHDDLLGMFMAARDEEGVGMSDEQLRDEVLTMLLAGHETTANALAWTFHHLSQNPAPTARLHEELDAIMPDRSFTLERYPTLTYSQQVLDETMRLSPPAWVESRRAEADDEIGGYAIPKGSFVFLSQYAIHRHPAYWVEPTRFNPDRFAPGGNVAPDGSPRPKGAYFPFGDGQRKCIGEHFAKMEARIILTLLASRFTFTAVPGREVLPDPSVTLRPRNGLPMKLGLRGEVATG
jgi:cytochrome P450